MYPQVQEQRSSAPYTVPQHPARVRGHEVVVIVVTKCYKCTTAHVLLAAYNLNAVVNGCKGCGIYSVEINKVVGVVGSVPDIFAFLSFVDGTASTIRSSSWSCREGRQTTT